MGSKEDYGSSFDSFGFHNISYRLMFTGNWYENQIFSPLLSNDGYLESTFRSFLRNLTKKLTSGLGLHQGATSSSLTGTVFLYFCISCFLTVTVFLYFCSCFLTVTVFIVSTAAQRKTPEQGKAKHHSAVNPFRIEKSGSKNRGN